MTVPFDAIVLTDFPFTDLTAAKRRPALVIIAGRLRFADPAWMATNSSVFFGVFGFG